MVRSHCSCDRASITLFFGAIGNLRRSRASAEDGRFHGASYANVQPLSASIANQVVIAALLKPSETLLGMDLDAGGYLSHGSKVNVSGKHFNSVHYGVTPIGDIDFEQVRTLTHRHKPKLIIAGTTAYPRTLDFERFRRIADDVGAYLLADITHIAGLVAAKEHPSPVNIAHITTMCTHKQLYGPRGGLILCGKDFNMELDESGITLSQKLDRGVFPLYQGAPALNKISAKARALMHASTPEFRSLSQRVKMLSQAMATCMEKHGSRVLFVGTDNHIVVVDVLTSFGMTGIVAQRALEECGIVINKNRIVSDSKPVTVASGVHLGTNGVAAGGLTEEAMAELCHVMVSVLRSVVPIDDRNYVLSEDLRESALIAVRQLCERFPLPGYLQST